MIRKQTVRSGVQNQQRLQNGGLTQRSFDLGEQVDHGLALLEFCRVLANHRAGQQTTCIGRVPA